MFEKREFYSIDGPWIPREDECSIYTVVLYLNDNFTGGETVFLKPNEEATHNTKEEETTTTNKSTNKANEFNGDNSNIETTDSTMLVETIAPKKEDITEIFKIRPEIGKAVVFTHDIYHEAAPLLPLHNG